MMLPELENLAQIAVVGVLNSVPEGILIAALAWLMLRALPRQNARTRFAVWFVALATVAGIPFIGALARTHALIPANGAHSLVTLSNHWLFIVLSVWLLGVGVAGSHLVVGMWRVHVLRRSCKPVDPDDLDPSLAVVARDFFSSGRITLASSDKLNVPAAIGFFRPTIVIPEWALRELTPEQFQIILLHEFAHLRRRDDWTNLVQKALRAVFIFHPAVWWIDRQLSLEREMACDDHVVAETGNAHGYAKCLVALLERSFARRALAMAQAAVRRADECRERLLRILDARRTTSMRFGVPAIALAGVFSLLCFAGVPHAPEFVAFAPSASSVHARSLPIFEHSKFASPAVIPAAMHVRTAAQRSASLRRNRPPAPTPHAIAAEGKATAVIPRVVQAKAKQGAIASETILVIRTTEQIGPDAWISRVTVWRLTYVSPHTQRVPVAKTT